MNLKHCYTLGRSVDKCLTYIPTNNNNKIMKKFNGYGKCLQFIVELEEPSFLNLNLTYI